MNKSKYFKTLALLVGPAAGAFGLWLLSEYPAIHASMCMAG